MSAPRSDDQILAPFASHEVTCAGCGARRSVSTQRCNLCASRDARPIYDAGKLAAEVLRLARAAVGGAS